MSSIAQLKTKIKSSNRHILARGELWLGTDLFQTAGLEDTIGAHFRLAGKMGHALVCLSVTENPGSKPDLGYRYFSFDELERTTALWDLPVFVTVDGPFQEMVNQMGLMEVLTRWLQTPAKINEIYGAIAEDTLSLISKLLTLPVAALVVADDMSSDTGPLVRPGDIDSLCTPFYKEAVKRAQACDLPVLLHCCGSLAPLLPMIRSWKIHGFAAVQSRINDLDTINRELGGNLLIMGGIEGDLLDLTPFPQGARQTLQELGKGLGAAGNLILSSSCGLYRGNYLDRMDAIYAVAESGVSGLSG